MSDGVIFDFSSYVIMADEKTGSHESTARFEVPSNKKHVLQTHTTNVSNGTSVFGNTNEIFTHHNFKEDEESLSDEFVPKMTQSSSPSEKITIRVTKDFVSQSLLPLAKLAQMQESTELSDDAVPNTF